MWTILCLDKKPWFSQQQSEFDSIVHNAESIIDIVTMVVYGGWEEPGSWEVISSEICSVYSHIVDAGVEEWTQENTA